MSETNLNNNTPGGTSASQINPLSSEAGPMESGEDQTLLYYNHYNQTQDMLNLGSNNTQLSASEKDFLYDFHQSRRISRSPTRTVSSLFQGNKNLTELNVKVSPQTVENQIKNIRLQEGSNFPNQERFYDELRKANEALAESNSINKQLNDTVAWMQERIKSLENEVKALKEKEPTNSSYGDKPLEVNYQTDEEQLAKDTEWVRVKSRNKKRKRNNTPSPPQLKEGVPKIVQKLPKKTPPPPPIVVDEVKNYDSLYEKIKTITTTDKFNTKVMNGNHIRINLEDGETYRKMTKILSEGQHSWHTFENKQTRPIRVIAKNLHFSCQPEKIIEDLKAKGFNATEATIKLKRQGKIPLNMCMLTFSADENIEKIYQIKYILGCKVFIQPIRKSKLIPQCKQCQSYGHTQKYCNKEPRCVKCAGKHHTKDCTKPKDVLPKCVHCGENHPANYRGCSVAIELQNIKNRNANAKHPNLIRKPTVRFNEPPTSKRNELMRNVNNTPQVEMGKMTYAQVTKNSENQRKTAPNDSINQTLQLILNKLNSFDERLQKLEYSTKGAIPKQKNDQRS